MELTLSLFLGMIRFKNLDSIRSIAFISTFLAHAFHTEYESVKSSVFFRWAISFSEVFSFGVLLFFVLSGFLITYLMMYEYESVGKFNLHFFYIRRILRIWPLYYLIITIGFLIFPFLRSFFLNEQYTETARWWMYLLFLGNFDQLIQQNLPTGIGLGVTWSVSVEEQFYFFWPLLFIFFPGKKFIFPIVLLFFISIFTSSFYLLPAKHTLFCVFYLSTGAIAAYIHLYYPKLSSRFTSISPFLYIMLLLFCILIMLNLKKIPIAFYPAGYVIVSLIMGYNIIYQIQCNETMNLKNIPGLEYWGKYTYGLYLYHTICNFIIFQLVKKLQLYTSIGETYMDLIIRPFLSFFLSLLISYISYQYFEKYFLRLKDKFR